MDGDGTIMAGVLPDLEFPPQAVRVMARSRLIMSDFFIL
jgi:hypothetical protein